MLCLSALIEEADIDKNNKMEFSEFRSIMKDSFTPSRKGKTCGTLYSAVKDESLGLETQVIKTLGLLLVLYKFIKLVSSRSCLGGKNLRQSCKIIYSFIHQKSWSCPKFRVKSSTLKIQTVSSHTKN